MNKIVRQAKYYLDIVFHYVFRKKSLGLQLIRIGVCGIGITQVAKFTITWAGQEYGISVATGDAPAYIAFTISSLLFVIALSGLVIVLTDWWREIKDDQDSRVLVIEGKGMNNQQSLPLKDSVEPKRVQKETAYIDIGPYYEGQAVTTPELALREVCKIEENVAGRLKDSDPSKVSVAFGGILPVPLLFTAGYLLDDQTSISVYDWGRFGGKGWSLPDQSDNGNEILIEESDFGEATPTDVLFIISGSYKIDASDIEQFTSYAKVVATAASIGIDNFHSLPAQLRMVEQIIAKIHDLKNKGVQTIHFLIAASSSVVFRIGAHYDNRNFPECLVYQYQDRKYPWAVRLNAIGKGPEIVRFDSDAS